MTDQYYVKEDMLPDTPQQAIQNWQAQSNSLAFIVPEVAEKLNETGALLYQVQVAAQERGDLGAVEQISVAWANIERMANQVVQIDSARAAAVEVIKVIDEARQQAEGELSTFNSEIDHMIETGETENPRLAELSDALNDHWSVEGFHCECPGCTAMEYGWYDCVGHDDVNDLFYALMSPSSEDVPTELRESLGTFLRDWAAQWNAHIDKLREQGKAVQAEYEGEES